ncbi:MAG: CDP-alcohol phosphatidyltransferase family protein [Actinobacteria bacterium]|nr:CDP-alcohol phosphatidyltransferase family protein [Actinomycetota bacterium]
MTDRGLFTVPNAISIVRLLCIPLFLWLLFGVEERMAAFALLAGLGATDWVDGWIARRFDQVSTVGKILDPVADRILLLTAVIALMVDGVVPTWVGVLVLVREAIVSAATLALALAGAARIDVKWAGKAGTFALMFALPGFLLIDVLDPGTGRDVAEVATWIATAGGLVLGYIAVAQYVPIARNALRSGRQTRADTTGVAA